MRSHGYLDRARRTPATHKCVCSTLRPQRQALTLTLTLALNLTLMLSLIQTRTLTLTVMQSLMRTRTLARTWMWERCPGRWPLRRAHRPPAVRSHRRR